MRGLDAEAILNEDYTCFRLAYSRCYGCGVVDYIGEGFGRYNHVVPALVRCVRRACCVLNGGVYGVWMKGIGAEVSCLENHSRFGDRTVVRAADEGDVDVV